MSPIWVVPQPVPAAAVRRIASSDEILVAVQKVDVPRVPAPHAIPRQLDPVALRLMALQLENDELREQVQQLSA